MSGMNGLELPRWLQATWLLGLGGIAAFRRIEPPAQSWSRRIWTLAWGWAIFGGFGLIVVWLALALLWFTARLGIVALAVPLTLLYLVTRLIRRESAEARP